LAGIEEKIETNGRSGDELVVYEWKWSIEGRVVHSTSLLKKDMVSRSLEQEEFFARKTLPKVKR
jgi:hypothetical protein